MNEVATYLKACHTFYLATTDKDQPRVRPFGAVCTYDNKLYIVTNNKKNVYRQMIENPKIEISGMAKGTWLRLEATVVHDSSREARVSMMEENPSLSSLYNVDDGLMEVFYLKDATATFMSYTVAPRVVRF